MLEHRTDQEDPSYAVEWTDRAGALIDFSTGYTFTLKLEAVNSGEVLLTKTTGFSAPAPVDGSPNLLAVWAAGELATLPAVEVYLHLTATTGGRDRVFRPGHPEVMKLVAPPT